MNKNNRTASEEISRRSSIFWLTPQRQFRQYRTYIVVGVERGGTSMVAGVMRALGIYGGKRLGRNHELPIFLSDDLSSLSQAIEIMNAEADVWWVKVPKLSLKLNFLIKNTRNPTIIFVNRNWTAVVNSWFERENAAPLEVMQHSLNYYTSVISSVSTHDVPAISVDYEFACRNPSLFLCELTDLLHIRLSDSNKNTALGMINSDGGGYLDLPDFNFSVLCVDKKLTEKKLLRNHQKFQNSEFKTLKKESDRLPIKAFGNQTQYLLIDLDILDANDIQTSKSNIRFYANFGEGFFPAHAHRPHLQNGNNLVLYVFESIPMEVSLGPLRDKTVTIKLNSAVYLENIEGWKFKDHRYKYNFNLLRALRKLFETAMD